MKAKNMFGLIVLVISATTLSAAPAPRSRVRAVEIATGPVGLAPGQTAALNVVDSGDSAAAPLVASLAIIDGSGEVLAETKVSLERGQVQTLELSRSSIDRPADRVPIRGVVRLMGSHSRGKRPVDVTLELVDDATRQTGAVLACPSDFLFAGSAGGRGDIFACPPPCTTTLVTP